MAETATPLSDAERKLHALYVADLRKRGFCKMDPATSGSTVLFNRFDNEREALSFLGNDFNAWLGERECENRSDRYILRGLKHISGQRFVPNGPDFLTVHPSRRTFANTYRRYVPTTECRDVSPLFHELYERMFPDPHDRRTVQQWQAHMFQRPQERPSWHMLWPSDTGTGKGFMVDNILTPLLLHTSTVRTYAQIMGQFSGVLASNLLVLIDDAKAKSEATQTQLKSLLSEERAYVEQKYGSAGMVDTYTRIILASNEGLPLSLEANERRWYVTAKIGHKVDRDETAKLIQRLADWLAVPGSLDAVYRWFMEFDLTGFHHKQVPASAGLAAMIELSRDPYADGIAEWAADKPVFTYRELVAGLGGLGLRPCSDTRLGHLIREAGFIARRTLIDGRQINLYRPADMPDDTARRLREAEPAF